MLSVCGPHRHACHVLGQFFMTLRLRDEDRRAVDLLLDRGDRIGRPPRRRRQRKRQRPSRGVIQPGERGRAVAPPGRSESPPGAGHDARRGTAAGPARQDTAPRGSRPRESPVHAPGPPARAGCDDAPAARVGRHVPRLSAERSQRAAISRATSSSRCSLHSVTRSRLVPRGTVGGRMASTHNP